MRYVGTFTNSHLVIGVASGPGQKQKNNTDAYAALEVRAVSSESAEVADIPVAIVAGGVSSDHAQKAGQLAVEAISAALGSHPHWPIQQLLVEALQRANRAIYQQAATGTQWAGMGATAIAAAMLPDTLYLAYVGDCRAYLIRNGAVYLLTVALAPSPVTALATRQAPTLRRAPLPPPSYVHFLGAAHLLGRADSVEVATAIIPPTHRPQNLHTRLPTLLTSHLALEANDTLLLCTPGLPREVTRQEIVYIVERYSLQEAAEQLAVQANGAGATRDYTVLMMQQRHRRAQSMPPGRKRFALRAGLLLTICLLLIVIGWSSLTEQGSRLVRFDGAPTPLVTVAPSAQENSLPTPETERLQSAAALLAPEPSPAAEATVADTPIDRLADASTLSATDVQPDLQPLVLQPVVVAAGQLYNRLALTTTDNTFQQNVADTLKTVGALVAAAHTATAVAALPTPTLTPTPQPTLPPPTLTSTPTSIPTSTPPRVAQRATPVPRRPTLTPTLTNTVQANPVAPRNNFANATVSLLEPAEKDTLNNKRPFRWEANFALPPGYAFEVVFWQRGQDPLRQGKGYAGLTEQAQVNASYDNFRQRAAPEGEYRWGVLLVIKEPYQRVKYLGGDRVIYVRSN